jgi:flagellar biosynthetic protein FlhB
MADKSQQTEKPTPRRLNKAREEGQFATARLFVGSLQFLTFVALIHSCDGQWVDAMHRSMALLLQHGLGARLEPGKVVELSLGFLKQALVPLALGGGIIMLLTLAAQLLVTRFGVSLKKLSPDLKRLSPLSKLRQLPKENIPALTQAMIMLPVFGAAVYYLVRDDFEGFLSLPLKSVSAGAAHVGASLQVLLWKASLLFMVFGAVDLFRQKQRYEKDLKMSKQEVRDEHKELEGNPLMKSRIRRLRRDMARRRMMHEIPTATAVIVNPTHFAVVLKYDASAPGAPRVVAKGKNYLALRIRQKAIENQVPLIENPPLAQALYKSVDVGQEIPAHFYRAVAEVLAYIFKLMNGRLPA